MNTDQQAERRGWYDADDVRQAANGQWLNVLARLDVRTDLLSSKHGPCPGCGGRDRFRFDDKNGEGTFLCSRGGGDLLSGDGLALLMHVKGWEWKRAVEEVGRLLLPDAVRTDAPRHRILEAGVAPPPVKEKTPKRPPFDLAKLESFVASTPKIDREWIKSRSKLPPDLVTTEDFLDAVYEPGERVLIFQDYYSQGDFLYVVGGSSEKGEVKSEKWHGSYRLGAEKAVKAVPSKLPTSGKLGVWFLVNPVTAGWDKVMKRKQKPDGSWEEVTEWTRRSWMTVTRWPYLVLESDEAPEELWIRALVNLALPITAIYSSGGRSLHALVKLGAESKAQWDTIRDFLSPMLCPIGADGGAMSAVRLSRLPGCMRSGKTAKTGRYEPYAAPQRQELIYLNPWPEYKPILTLKGGSDGR